MGNYFVTNLVTGDVYKLRHRDIAEALANRFDNDYNMLCSKIEFRDNKKYKLIKRGLM